MDSKTNINRPLYNSRIIDTYIKLIKSKYSYVNIGELLSYANMKSYEVADQGHWFTQEQVDRFYEKLVQSTGNNNISREAGRYSASPEAIGVMRQYILGFVDPAKVFELTGKAASNFTRSAVYQSCKIAANKVEITVTPLEGVKEKPFQCENRIGFFEAMVNIYTNKFPHIDHPECFFKGGNSCRYIISWERSKSAIWKKIRNFTFILLPVVFIPLIILGYWQTAEVLFPVLLVIYLFISLIAQSKEKKDIQTSLEHTRDSVEKLVDEIDINYNNALLTNEIGQAISKQINVDDILTNVVQVLEKRLDYDRGLILLVNSDNTMLVLQAGFGYSGKQLDFFDKVVFHLNRPESRGIFVVCFREKKPFLINDLNDIQESLSAKSLAFAKRLGTKAFICCPIICDDKTLGVLAVDNLKSKRPLVQSDMSRLMGVASVIGISIRNAELMEARVRQFNSVLQVLAASIDARDSLTAGHSGKVTEYAMGICQELSLSRDYSEVIRVASLLHDYGKIGVPDAILKKEGKLTVSEYEIVKTHSDKTREILAQVHFEGIYREVPEIAGSHHEKVDGTGYPQGLKGKNIPFGAKIIAVADYFEAVTSKRHYRDPMIVEEAFRLLREEVGKHFERKCVEALISYYTRNYLDSKPESLSQPLQRGPKAQFRGKDEAD